MLKKKDAFDFVIIGAGIIGLSTARELLKQFQNAKIAIVEKEDRIGLHASSRNSGVLHSGIYYSPGSLKAILCRQGSQAMAEYCDKYELPINRIGKIIIPNNEEDLVGLDILYKRAQKNGVKVEKISANELKKLEPEAKVSNPFALYSPETSIVDPKAILNNLYKSLYIKKVTFYFNRNATKIDPAKKEICFDDLVISYGHLFNTAGLYADKVASACGLSEQFTMVPFKGMYYKLAQTSSLKINHLIYPVPDMNVPFLGIHFTKSIDGSIYVGPTAIPAFGREQYKGFKGLRVGDMLEMFWILGQQYFSNKQGFRNYTHNEITRFIKWNFIKFSKGLIPKIEKHDLVKCSKVGIRAQLFDKKNKNLMMDFVVKNTENETHVLNAVSPAFTSAFSFSKYLVKGCKSPGLMNVLE